MARVSCKSLLLLGFLLLCFFSVPTRGRNLRAVSSKEAEKRVEHQHVVTGDQVDGSSNDDGLLDMDYTPARRKPPIHN